MASNDSGYITLRNVGAYQSNGNPVPSNQVLVTTATGNAGFSNNLNISTLSVSTFTIVTQLFSTVTTNFLTVNSTAVISSLSGNQVTTNFLTVNSTGVISSLSGNQVTTNFLTVNSTAVISSLTLSELTMNFLTVNSTATISSLNTNVISTGNITSNYISTFNDILLINNENNLFGDNIEFYKSIGFQSTVSTTELGYINFYGTNPSQNFVRGAYILARQSGIAGTLAPTDLQFVTNMSSGSENVNMVIKSDGKVGINTTNPNTTLYVAGNSYISTGLTLNNAQLGFGALKIQDGATENTMFISDGSVVSSIQNSGYFVGVSAGFGGASTFQIGRIDSNNNEISKAIYLTQAGNAGIGDVNSNFKFYVAGNSYISSGLTLSNLGVTFGALKIQNALNENSILIQDGTSVSSLQYSGYFVGVSTDFGGASTFQIGRIDEDSTQINKALYLTQIGNVGVGDVNPNYKLYVAGSSYISSGLTLNNANVAFGGLKVQNGLNENSILISDGTSVSSIQNSGYFVGVSVGFGGASTFQIGRIDADSTQINKALYLTQAGNVGIATATPQVSLQVNGAAIFRKACSTIDADPGSIGVWNGFFGKYCFVTLPSANLTIPIPPDIGTNVVIRNNTSDLSPITVNTNTIEYNSSLTFVFYTDIPNIPSQWYTF